MFAEIEATEREQRAPEAPCLFGLDLVGYFARLELAEHWNAVYGDTATSIRAAHAWMPCVTQMFAHHEPTAQCRPTILLADLRCDHYRGNCCCVGDLLYRAACFGCTWEGPARTRENTAAEDAHDHAWPGWRELPLVPRRPEAGTSTKQKAATARWVEAVNDRYPQGWLESSGPIRTARGHAGTRHVPDHTGFGGYDLCGQIEPEPVR
jgi:hypothetical protein